MYGTAWQAKEIADLSLPWAEFSVKYPERTRASYDSKIGRMRAARDQLLGRRSVVAEPEVDEPEELTEEEVLKTDVLGALKREALTTEELCNVVDRGPATVRAILATLKRAGYEVAEELVTGKVVLDRQRRQTDLEFDLTEYIEGEWLRMGIISCTHYGNVYYQPKALGLFYKQCEAEECVAVLHCGDLTDGMNMYRGQRFDLYATGHSKQVANVVAEYPHSTVPTYVIGGNHDFSFQKNAGANVVRAICEKHSGLNYAGLLAATVKIGKSKILMLHSRGGVPYARSYRSQRLNEQLGRGERVPDVFAIGGLHVTDYISYLGIDMFLCGAFQGQTPYLKEKGLYPEIGGWIAHLHLSPTGIVNRVKLEWVKYPEVRPYGESEVFEIEA